MASRRMEGRLERLGRTGCGYGNSGEPRVRWVGRRGEIRVSSDGGRAREGVERVHEGVHEGVLEEVLEGIHYLDGERTGRVLNQTCKVSTSVC
jgi:hypothetical protein